MVVYTEIQIISPCRKRSGLIKMVQKKLFEKKIGCSFFYMLWVDPLWHIFIRGCSNNLVEEWYL